MDINLFDLEIENKLKNLRPTPGYCIFVDIVDSTKMKDDDFSAWVRYLGTTLSLIQAYIQPQTFPLKCIGDELMFYIPKEKMWRMGETPANLFDRLCRMVKHDEPHFKPVKISVAFCTNAYEISFVSNTPDIYGKDIDLTARLLSLASSWEIIMNEGFVKSINSSDNKESFPEIKNILGPWPVKLKGFADYIDAYKAIIK